MVGNLLGGIGSCLEILGYILVFHEFNRILLILENVPYLFFVRIISRMFKL